MKKKKTQAERVLTYIREHDGITSCEAWVRLNIVCLPARIRDLRRQGYDIDMTWQKNPEGERFGLYTLREE